MSSAVPCRIYLDNCDQAGANAALVGLCVGQDARRFAACPPVVRKRAVLDQLARLDGVDARQCAAYLDHDWKAETWSDGGYFASMPPGLLTAVGKALREPFGRVHFAGTETARHCAGYIDGAIEAGERAAQQVLAVQ